jgi:AP-3 complex subunit mu
MDYRFEPSASKPGAAPALTAAAAAQLQVQVPFALRAALSVTDHGGLSPSILSTPNMTKPQPLPGAFELTFSPRAAALDDVAVELYLGAGASGATCSAVTGGGEWTYVPAHRKLRWSLPPTASGRNATLRGTFTSTDAHPRPARAAQVSFALPAGAMLSALKVDQLKLSGETYKPYKGVRARALGRVEWRVEWRGG